MNSSSACKERGGAVFAVVFLLALPVVFVFGGAFLTSVVTAGAREDGVEVPGESLTSSPLEAPASPAPVEPISDLGTGGLVKVDLPNVSWPKVPALDRRVAPMLFGTIKALNAEGVENVTFNYFFRTSAQQAQITPVGTTLKAKPGTSDHERGTAIDVAGMSVRPDAGRIVEAFKRSGFSWLGPADRPHFFVPAWKLGEADKFAFLKRQQQHYQSGAWKH